MHPVKHTQGIRILLWHLAVTNLLLFIPPDCVASRQEMPPHACPKQLQQQSRQALQSKHGRNTSLMHFVQLPGCILLCIVKLTLLGVRPSPLHAFPWLEEERSPGPGKLRLEGPQMKLQPAAAAAAAGLALAGRQLHARISQSTQGMLQTRQTSATFTKWCIKLVETISLKTLR